MLHVMDIIAQVPHINSPLDQLYFKNRSPKFQPPEVFAYVQNVTITWTKTRKNHLFLFNLRAS